ncbi:hypothetical protein FCV25MIE_01150 [Fagus crenata]
MGLKRETQIDKEGSEKIRSAKSERVARGRRVPGQRAPARADSGSGGDGRISGDGRERQAETKKERR